MITQNKIQCKHIPDVQMIALVRKCQRMPRTIVNYWGIDKDPISFYDLSTTNFDLLTEIWYNVPPKVMQAKLKKLIKRGLLDGCACGCRGDFEVTEAGLKFEIAQYEKEAALTIAAN